MADLESVWISLRRMMVPTSSGELERLAFKIDEHAETIGRHAIDIDEIMDDLTGAGRGE